MNRLVQPIISLLSYLPLRLLHWLGVCAGLVVYYSAKQFTSRIKTNLILSDIPKSHKKLIQLVKKNTIETAKNLLEITIAWNRSLTHIASLVKTCNGWELVDQARKNHQGIVFVTPHLGSFEIGGRYLSQRLPYPLTAMYRPPKLAWLNPIMQQGRIRGKGKIASADKHGVRLLLKALKQREAILMLPDQVPSNGGDGIWAPFFDHPAYTMTLISRLARMDNVTILFYTCERLPHAQGFHMHIEPPLKPFTGDSFEDASHVNQMVEHMIRRLPSQYLWSYNRYKCPAGVEKPNTSTESYI